MPVHEDPTRTRPSLDSQEGQKASSWPTRTSRWAQTDGSLLTDRAMFTNFTSPRYLKFLSLPCCGLADDFLFYGGYGVEPPGLVICSGIGVLNCARMTATGPFKVPAAPAPPGTTPATTGGGANRLHPLTSSGTQVGHQRGPTAQDRRLA